MSDEKKVLVPKVEEQRPELLAEIAARLWGMVGMQRIHNGPVPFTRVLDQAIPMAAEQLRAGRESAKTARLFHEQGDAQACADATASATDQVATGLVTLITASLDSLLALFPPEKILKLLDSAQLVQAAEYRAAARRTR